MYTLKVSYGVDDKPEMATVEIFGTYKTWDEACEAAQSKFDTIKERLCNDPDICIDEDEDDVRCFDCYESEYSEEGGHFAERITEVNHVFLVYDCYSHVKIYCEVSVIIER